MKFFFNFYIFGGDFLKFLDPIFILYCVILYTNLHTKFQKESLNVCRIQSKYKCASFMLKQPGSEKISKFFVYCKFSTKNFKKNIFCYRGPETSKKAIFFWIFLIFGGFSDYPVTLFSFSIMPCPMPTYIPNFKRIHPCL